MRRIGSELAADGAVGALGFALGDTRELVRSNAVWALTRIGSHAAQIAARRALADSDFRIRQAACQSAFATEDHNALEQLMSLLRDEAPAVRREAARALGRLGLPDAVLRLGDAAAAVEHYAVLTPALVYGLIEIADPDETRKLLEDRRPRVRRAGLIALDQSSPGSLSAESVFDALRSPDAVLRSAALAIAAKHSRWGPEAAAYLEFAFADAHRAGFSETGARILPAFLPAPEVRAWFRKQLSPGSSFSVNHLRAGLAALLLVALSMPPRTRPPPRGALA